VEAVVATSLNLVMVQTLMEEMQLELKVKYQTNPFLPL
tara:strand:+ start:383 stop:496 length:114 start_codon:yes stop_codon:yes gene_type:complete